MATLTYTIGDVWVETVERRISGTLTDGTLTATVYKPDGTTASPTVAHPSTGIYTVSTPIDQAGDWYLHAVFLEGGAKDTYVTARRSEQAGANLIADALVTVSDMRFFLDRTGMTADLDETRWLEDLINSYSLAVARYCNRQFTPERNGPGTRWPLKTDPVDPDGSSKTYTYDGNGYLSLAPYEARAVTAVVMGADLPTAQQVTLFAGDSSREAEYRLEPAAKTTEGTYTWLALPTAPYGHVSWTTSTGVVTGGRQVKVTGDWGAPLGLIPLDVQHALKIAVGQAFRNPEDWSARSDGGVTVTGEPWEFGPGALPPDSLKLLQPYRR